jgi:hypothetical protein
MTLLRRYLTVIALCVWQGGFTFYAAFVVPIGTEALGSAKSQGFITRQVTDALNACGAFALALMAWDLAACRDPRPYRRVGRFVLFALMAVAAAALYRMHARLDGLLDVPNEEIVDRRVFRPLHRAYLWISAGQWACAAAYLGLSLGAWRGEDSGSVQKEGPK